jgi:hypothetical protein
LPDEFFFVVQLRIKIDEIDTGKSSHSFLFPSHGVCARDCNKPFPAPAIIPEFDELICVARRFPKLTPA